MIQKEIQVSPYFWLRRLHSLSGIFPIGVFLLEHIFTNSFITHGPEAYNSKIEFLSSLPYLIWIEVIFIFIPILYHAFYGMHIMFTGKNNLAWYPYPGNWLYTLQRWTGLIAFVYIGMHVWETRLAYLLYGTEVSFARMQEIVSDPKVFWFYVAGLASVIFHFANGVWGFLISWGITVGAKAQRASGILCILIGLTLFYVGMDALVHLMRISGS